MTDGANDDARYVLGASEAELVRLERQHAVWAEPMAAWLDALDLRAGMTVVDAGCGPGAATFELHERVGDAGLVIGVDRSAAALAVLERRAEQKGVSNLRTLEGDLASVRLDAVGVPDGSCDAVVLRWVLTFPPEPQRLLANVARWLAPGGRVLVVDYDHDGVAVFPRSAGFEAMVRGVRALFRSQGGDPWIACRLPELFDATGLDLESFDPRLLSGPLSSPVGSWVGDFLHLHAGGLVDGGFVTAQERAAFEREWAQRAANPHALFVSPIVVGAVASKRATDGGGRADGSPDGS